MIRLADFDMEKIKQFQRHEDFATLNSKRTRPKSNKDRNLPDRKDKKSVENFLKEFPPLARSMKSHLRQMT